MSTESEKPFSMGPDKPLRMRAATLISIIIASVAGSLFAQNISSRLSSLSDTVSELVSEHRVLSKKVDRLEWMQNGRRGPEPDPGK